MICLFVTQTQAEVLAACCIDPTLRADLQKQIRNNQLAGGDDMPRTVILEDHGDGLHYHAVAYFSDEAATKAADRWWAEVVQDNLDAAEEAARIPLLVEGR